MGVMDNQDQVDEQSEAKRFTVPGREKYLLAEMCLIWHISAISTSIV
jgi:hypothetical protein